MWALSTQACTTDSFFTWLQFDRGSSGLAGLSFDEGEFGVFGYVTGGSDVIPQLGTGDKVINAKVVSGADKLSR